MARTALDGELSRATRRQVRYTVATRDDEPALRRLLRDNPMRGAITLTFEREPNYFVGTHLADADDTTIVAHDGPRLVCMGRCVTRTCSVNGLPRRVAYLGELRLDATAQGRFDILRGGYRFFHELQRTAPADVTFTSIAADNLRARRLLERGVPWLPRYGFLTEFVTLLLPTRGTRPSVAANVPQPELDRAELVEFLNDHASRYQLAAWWTEEKLASLEHHGLGLEDFSVTRGHDGQIVAAAGLWDQRSFRQTVVRGYSPALALARPWMNLAARAFGTPHLPPVDRVLAHALVCPFALSSDASGRLPDLIAMLAGRAARLGLEYLTLGFAAGDPRLGALQDRFRHRAYLSRLYRVRWPEDAGSLALDARPFLPEIAFL